MSNAECLERCVAQLCPADADVDKHLWYPDEPVCTSRRYSGVNWLRTQRKIAALHLRPDAGYFNVRMLGAINRVTPGLKGANPDDVPASENQWLAARAKHRTRTRLAEHGSAGSIPGGDVHQNAPCCPKSRAKTSAKQPYPQGCTKGTGRERIPPFYSYGGTWTHRRS